MEKLEKHIRKNGFDYHLIKRGDKSFIYKQMDKKESGENFIVSYEVFKKIIEPEKTFFNKLYPERERFPANEDFGKTAWSHSNKDKAFEKFEILEKELDK